MDQHTQYSQQNILLIGAGVIGSVYACQLTYKNSGELFVLAHGERTHEVAKNGLIIKEIGSKRSQSKNVIEVANIGSVKFEIVIVALQADQLASIFPIIKNLQEDPLIILLGNNPDGYKIIPRDLPKRIVLAFPGISGRLNNGIVEYVKVEQQPTTFARNNYPECGDIINPLNRNGLKTHITNNMDGWLAYHSVFIACISCAILISNLNTRKLGRDKVAVRQMCRAIEEGFRMLAESGIKGAPTNLKILHSKAMRLFAVNYWSKLMKSDQGELYFGSHVRNAPYEVKQLARWTLSRPNFDTENFPNLSKLLPQARNPSSA